MPLSKYHVCTLIRKGAYNSPVSKFFYVLGFGEECMTICTVLLSQPTVCHNNVSQVRDGAREVINILDKRGLLLANRMSGICYCGAAVCCAQE